MKSELVGITGRSYYNRQLFAYLKFNGKCKKVEWPRKPIERKLIKLRIYTRAQLKEPKTSSDISNEDEDEIFSGFRHIVKAEEEMKAEDEEEKEKEREREKARLAKESKEKTEKKTIEKLMEIDESSEERAPYHKRIFAAARRGRPMEVEEALQDMIAENLRPGPRCFHGLIFAYVKSNNTAGALHAIRRAHSSGVRPIPESYVVLVHSFVKDGNLSSAEAVMVSLRRTGANVRQGWLMLVGTLFKMNKLDEALSHLAKGRAEKWSPDSALYELILSSLLKAKMIKESEKEIDILISDNLVLEACHVNGLLAYYAKDGELNRIMSLVKKTKKFDVHTYNSILRGILNKWETKNQDLGGMFMSEWAKLIENRKVTPNFESWLMLMQVKLKNGKIQQAKQIYVENKLMSISERNLKKSLISVTADLLNALGKANYPVDLHQVLMSISIYALPMPQGALRPDDKGRTFASNWLAERMANTKISEKSEEPEPKENVMVMGQTQEVDGVMIGFCNCAVDEDGSILSLSKMSIPQLQAELKARGLSSEGVRKDLYDRIRISRSTLPVIREEMRRMAKLKTRQRLMERRTKEENMPKIAGSQEIVEEETNFGLINFGSDSMAGQRAVDKDELEFEEPVVEPDTGDDGSKPTLATDIDGWGTEDADGKYKEDDLANDLYGEEKQEGFLTTSSETWSDTFILSSKIKSDIGTNTTAGSLAAVAICNQIIAIGDLPMLEDLELIIAAATVEKNAAAAFGVSQILGSNRLPFKLDMYNHLMESDKTTQYNHRSKRLFETAVRMCVSFGFPDSALEVVERMREKGIVLDSELLQLVKKKRMDKISGSMEDPLTEEILEKEEGEEAEVMVGMLTKGAEKKRDGDVLVIDEDDLDFEEEELMVSIDNEVAVNQNGRIEADSEMNSFSAF